MLLFEGDFAVEGAAYAQHFAWVSALGVFADIVADQDTTLLVCGANQGRYGETRVLVGGVDTEAEVPQAWCTDGVQTRAVTVRIDIAYKLKHGEALEALVHEWCLHGAPGYRFAQAMRVADSPETVADLHRTIVGTATHHNTVDAHRELAEDTHEYFHTTLHQLKDAHPEAADELLAAWQADVDNYGHAARAGRKATAHWGAPLAVAEPAEEKKTSEGDGETLGYTEDEQKGYDDFFSDDDSK